MQPGNRLGPYEIVAPLGAGGMVHVAMRDAGHRAPCSDAYPSWQSILCRAQNDRTVLRCWR